MSHKFTLITNASNSFGRALIVSLAKCNHNLLLVDHDEIVLVNLADEIKKKYPIQTQVIAADLSQPEIPFRLLTMCNQLGIVVTMLVNNPFEPVRANKTYSVNTISHFTRMNIEAVVAVSELFLRNNPENDSGYVMNILNGNETDNLSLPWSAVHSFILSYSKSLRKRFIGNKNRITLFTINRKEKPETNAEAAAWFAQYKKFKATVNFRYRSAFFLNSVLRKFSLRNLIRKKIK